MRFSTRVIVALCACGVVLGVYADAGAQSGVRTIWNQPFPDDYEVVEHQVDADGNVFLTGTEDGIRSLVTIKYGGDGSFLWERRYNGPAFIDAARDLALDVTGHVIVTGLSYDTAMVGGSILANIAIVKYDSDGNTLWERRYHGDNLVYGHNPNELVVDNAGNVYVAGISGRAGSDTARFVTLKYDPDGQLLWEALYVTGRTGGVNAIAVDEAGNVYVNGDLGRPAYGTVTIRYDGNGNEVWNDFIEDGSSRALEIGPDGNIYICGARMFDCTTVKYDSSGNLLWLQTYDGTDHETDEANDLYVDTSGNVYVVGYTNGARSDGHVTGTEMLLLKYDRNGNLIQDESFYEQMDCPEWYECQTCIDGEWGNCTACLEACDNFSAYAIDVDSAGSIYVLGGGQIGDVEPGCVGEWFWCPYRFGIIQTWKFDSSGNHIWTRQHATAGLNFPPIANYLTRISVTAPDVFHVSIGGSPESPHGRTLKYAPCDGGELGDVNCDAVIDSLDVALLDDYLSLNVDPTESCVECAGDMDQDGDIDGDDQRLLGAIWLPGDMNCDAYLDLTDVVLLGNVIDGHFVMTGTCGEDKADVNGDGDIDEDDYNLLYDIVVGVGP